MRRLITVVCIVLSLVSLATTVGAVSRDDNSFLSLYFSDEELEIFSATRSLKSVASIADNVVVVTAEEIEFMNAHTVAEALYNVTGIELEYFKGPGSGSGASVHGSGDERIMVLLDGVPLVSPSNDFQLGTLPVQIVRKIEVVKGPASSTWGSSFGGVINVITKSVESTDRVRGVVAASIGRKATSDVTSDVRAEVSGRKGRLGIYLYGGRMDSDGLVQSNEFTHENFFGKLSFDAGPRTSIDLSFFSHNSDSVTADFLQSGRDVYEGFLLDMLFGKADLRTSFSEDVDLYLTFWRIRSNDNFYQKQLSTDAELRDVPILFDRQGVSGSIAWRTKAHALVAGADLSSAEYEEEFGPRSSIELSKRALYVNDTITAGDLSVTAGLRHDHSSLAGDLVSPSLGATYLASRDLLFRAVVSRGFHEAALVRYLDAPPLLYYANEEITPEKIWSYQAGVEANVSNLLRAKFTLFYHDIDDILIVKSLDDKPLDEGTYTLENGGMARTVGGELEFATNSFKGFVIKSGAHYEQVKLINFSDPRYFDVRDVYGVNAALDYAGEQGVRGTVKAHYLWWDMTEAWGAASGGIVVDCTIAKKFLDTGKIALELFAGAHNIFNARSYSERWHHNPERWGEAGVRCTF